MTDDIFDPTPPDEDVGSLDREPEPDEDDPEIGHVEPEDDADAGADDIDE